MDQLDDRWQREQERWARRQQRWAQKQERWATRQERWADKHHSPVHGAMIGGVIIMVGAALLLNNMGIIHFRDVWQFWPAILVVVGLAKLIEARSMGGLLPGALLAGFGGLLLAANLGLFYFNWHIVWPIALIGWGFIILVRPHNWHGPSNFGPPPQAPPAAPGTPRPQYAPSSDPGTLGLWTLFGGGRRQVDSQDFRGGEVSAIFGGYEVDLRGASIAADKAVIDVTAIFGGVEIKVPGTWIVEARGVGIFGGFGDETRPPRPGEVTREQRLIVTGTAAFGGVSIKN